MGPAVASLAERTGGDVAGPRPFGANGPGLPGEVERPRADYATMGFLKKTATLLR
jgi:hypothetical protein